MNNLKANQYLYTELQQQIERAQRLNKPIDKLVKQQIQILEETHDQFVTSTLTNNKNLESDLGFTEVRIKQLQAIASLCKKIGLSTEKYDEKIREIRIKNLGVDFVNEHYKKEP